MRLIKEYLGGRTPEVITADMIEGKSISINVDLLYIGYEREEYIFSTLYEDKVGIRIGPIYGGAVGVSASLTETNEIFKKD